MPDTQPPSGRRRSGRVRRMKGGTDWSCATQRLPASFADQPRPGDGLVEGRRHDDGLDLVETVTGALALAAIAELATGDGAEPAREDAVGVNDEDVVAAEDEDPADAEPAEEASDEKE